MLALPLKSGAPTIDSHRSASLNGSTWSQIEGSAKPPSNGPSLDPPRHGTTTPPTYIFQYVLVLILCHMRGISLEKKEIFYLLQLCIFSLSMLVFR